MDFGLVSLSLIEELAALLAAASFLDVSALRMLRMCRGVRVRDQQDLIVLAYSGMQLLDLQDQSPLHFSRCSSAQDAFGARGTHHSNAAFLFRAACHGEWHLGKSGGVSITLGIQVPSQKVLGPSKPT